MSEEPSLSSDGDLAGEMTERNKNFIECGHNFEKVKRARTITKKALFIRGPQSSRYYDHICTQFFIDHSCNLVSETHIGGFYFEKTWDHLLEKN